MNTITKGVATLLENQKAGPLVSVFIVGSVRHFERVRREGKGPDMVIARPGVKDIAKEDGGRTLIIPWPADLPKVYAMPNEENGVTVMLADEY